MNGWKNGKSERCECIYLLLDRWITRHEDKRICSNITYCTEEHGRCTDGLTEREMFYGYMASDIWLRTILIVRKENRCCHIGYSYRLTARVLLYAPSHRQDNTYHRLCYTSCGALAGTRNSSMGPPHEGSIRQPITP